MVWAERLENCQQALFYPRMSGELFLMKTERSPLQKFETSVQDLARAGTAEFDWGYYFQGSVHKSSYLINLKSGSVVPTQSTSDCSVLTLERTDYRVDLVEKKRLTAVSQINVSEISERGCLETDLSVRVGEYEKVRRRFGEVRFLGFYRENFQLDSWTWVFSYPKTLFLFVLLSLGLGFKLGVKAEDETLRVTISPCRSPRSGLATASTSAMASPMLENKLFSSLSPRLRDGNLSLSSRLRDGKRLNLAIVTQTHAPRRSFEADTPLHASSDAKINDLISDGRFTDTFESAHLLYDRGGQQVYEARHRLEGKAYVVKVAKFAYEQNETIAEVTMFREVAAMMRFRHKNIVNYVTCWVENSHAIPPDDGIHNCESEEEDSHPEACPVSPSSSRKTGYLYIQRELVKGETLKEMMKHREKVDRRENCLIFRQILKAVAHIHEKKIVHRAINPRCIYVTPTDVVKISDFRLAAKARSYSSRHSMLLPDSPYTAPEYHIRPEVTKEIDIYPLGPVLLELSLPNTLTSEQKERMLVGLKSERSLPACVGGLMGAEKAIILKLAAIDPRERPSAKELLDSELLREWEKEVGLSPCLTALSPCLVAATLGQEPL